MFLRIFKVHLLEIQNKNIFVYILALGILLLFVNNGISNYKVSQIEISNFKKVESEIVNQYRNYPLYGAYGIKIKNVPTPFVILFSPGFNMIAHVNVLDRLDIYVSLKGKGLRTNASGFLTVTWILFLIFCVYNTIYGFKSFLNIEKILFLSNFASKRKILFYTYISRLIIINAIFFLTILAICFLILVNGVELHWFDLKNFSVTGGVILNIIFAGSVFFSRFKNGKAILYISLIVIFILHWVIIGVEGKTFDSIPGETRYSLKKLKIIMSFEKRVNNIVEQYLKGKIGPENIIYELKNLMNGEYKQLESIEDFFRESIIDKTKEIHFISAFIPTVFYQNVSKEVSGIGLKNLIDFFDYIRGIKIEFINFYVRNIIDHLEYVKKHKNLPSPGVKNFIKADENIFYAESNLPYYFTLGMVVNTCYFLLLSIINFFLLLWDRHPKKIESLQIDLQPGKLNYFLTRAPAVKEYVIHQLKEKNATIDGKKLEKDSFYLPSPGKLPQGMLDVLYPGQKNKPAWECLLQKGLNSGKVIVGDGFLEGLKDTPVNVIKKKIKEKNALFIEIGKDRHQFYKSGSEIFWERDPSIEIGGYQLYLVS